MNFEQVKQVRNISDGVLIDVALKLFASDYTLFEKLRCGGAIELLVAGRQFFLSEEQLEKLRDVQRDDPHTSRKVTTIKVCRELTRLGLKEAKDMVECLGAAGILNRSFARDSDYEGYHDTVHLVSDARDHQL